MEPRFEWTRDKMLVLKEVTHADQGLYAIKLSSGFTYETVHLTVSGTRVLRIKIELKISIQGNILIYFPFLMIFLSFPFSDS